MSEPIDPERAVAVRPYPGPLSALLLTLFAVLLTGLVVGLLGFTPDAGVVGIAEAIGLGVTGSMAARRVPAPHTERLGLRGFEPRLIVLVALLVPVILLASELDNWLRAAPYEPTAPWTQASFLAGLQLVLVAVALIPVVEEWFFRGVLQQGLIGSVGRVNGVLFTASLYAMMRLPVTGDGGATSAAFVGGLGTGVLLGLLRLASGSILAPILLSAGINTAFLLADAYRDVMPIAGFTGPGHTSMEWLLPAAMAVGFAVSQLVAELRVVDARGGDPRAPEAASADGADDAPRDLGEGEPK